MTDDTLPHIEPGEIGGERTPATVHGVLLAAGTSSRFGRANKLLEPVSGEPLVRHAARTLAQSATDGVTVVVGHEASRVREAVEDLEVAVRENDAYEAGQSTSVREGVLAAADAGADAVLIALGDMPDVSTETVDWLIESYERGVGSAVAPAHGGQRGNPVVFDSRYFDSLVDVSGDVGGREILLSGEDSVLLAVEDPGVLRDVDRPEDL